MNTNSLPRIESIKAKAPTSLVIVWSTSDVTPVDLAQIIARTRAYKPLARRTSALGPRRGLE